MYTCIHVHMYTCIYVYMYMFIYVYMYIYLCNGLKKQHNNTFFREAGFVIKINHNRFKNNLSKNRLETRFGHWPSPGMIRNQNSAHPATSPGATD